MQPTIRLDAGYSTVHLRFQAPALTVNPCQVGGSSAVHGSASITHANFPSWQANADKVTLNVKCQQSSPFLFFFELELVNHGEAVEVRVALPYLFYHFDQSQPVRVFNPRFGGVLEATTVPICISYPGPASFCLTAAAGLDCALAVGILNEPQRHVVIRHLPAGADGQIRFVYERVWLNKGQSLTLPPQFVSTGVDWSQAMSPYRDWFHEAFHRPRLRPTWWAEGNFSETRYAHCLAPFHPPEAAAGVWIFDNQGRSRSFEQVKEEVDTILAQGQREGFMPLFYQFGWWQNMADIQGLFMFDSVCGDYTAAHSLAKQVVEYIHTRGARTYFYTNAISAGDESMTYRSHPGLFARDASGFPLYNMDYPMLMFCPGAPGIRAYWEKVLHYLLIDLGVDGIFLDQVCGGAPPVYCYDPEHHHEHPDTYGKDFLDLINFIGETARRMNPECFIGGELVQDTRGILIDEVHGYGYTGPRSTPPDDPFLQKSTPPSEYYVFTRFLCPEIYSGINNSPMGLMNGAAGHHANPLWRQYRKVFESDCIPCRVSCVGAAAYLYGPVNGTAVLAVRAQGDGVDVLVYLPLDLDDSDSLPEGLTRHQDRAVSCKASKGPIFFILHLLDPIE